MNELEKGDVSTRFSEEISSKNGEVPKTYCDVCFIAFGSQEKRVYLNDSVVHPDCVNKINFKY
jgi:hypothetical protein